ncbi:unnamed protein product [Mortierella alpina]
MRRLWTLKLWLEHLANKIKEDEFKQWMTEYFTVIKKNKKMSVQNIVDQQRTKLQVSGVHKSSKLIQSEMDILVPEVNSAAASGTHADIIATPTVRSHDAHPFFFTYRTQHRPSLPLLLTLFTTLLFIPLLCRFILPNTTRVSK